MERIKKNLEERSQKSISILKEDLNTVRAGRANPSLLDKVMVEYYGTPTPLKNLANISVPDPRTLLITPFDAKSIHEIEKGINVANIGITPSNDRKELTKTVKKMGEESKIAIRNIRRDANDELKKLEKTHEITEDELKKALDDIQKATDKTTKEIDSIIAGKEKEILEV